MMDWRTIIKRSIRLFHTATGPTREEYDRIVKITFILAFAMGSLGLLIHFVLNII